MLQVYDLKIEKGIGYWLSGEEKSGIGYRLSVIGYRLSVIRGTVIGYQLAVIRIIYQFILGRGEFVAFRQLLRQVLILRTVILNPQGERICQ